MNVVEQLRADAITRRRMAARKLNEILLRADAPTQGDKEGLAEAMAILGLQLEDLAQLREAAEKCVAYKAMLADAADQDRARVDILRRLDDVDKWARAAHADIDREAEDKRIALNKERRPIEVRLTEIQTAKSQTINVVATWLSLAEGCSLDEARNNLRSLSREDQLNLVCLK